MKKQILNLEGVAVLTKEQQRAVNGGQVCRFTVMMNGETQQFAYPGFSEGSQGSTEANEACLRVLANTQANRCFYDCAHDGFGQ